MSNPRPRGHIRGPCSLLGSSLWVTASFPGLELRGGDQLPTLGIYAGSQGPPEQKRPNDLSEAAVIDGAWAPTENERYRSPWAFPAGHAAFCLSQGGRLSDLEVGM